MKRPNLFLQITLGTILKMYAMAKGQKITRTEKIKRPSIVLSNHTSFHDYSYTYSVIYPHRVNFLAADKMFYEKGRGFFLRLSRSIPKCLFQTDTRSVIAALNIIKKKRGIIGIFPEGQISMIGRTYEIPYSIAKFIRKANVDVYIARHHNVYFVNPPWSKKTFRGPIKTTVEKILTTDEIAKISDDDIYQLISEKLDYNASIYNEIYKYKYKVNNINNLENVIYRCPNCQTNGLKANKYQLECPTCQEVLAYNEYGKLGKYSLYELYTNQEKAIQQEINANLDFNLKSDVILESYNKTGIVCIGQGTLTLNRNYYIYEGMMNGENVLLRFETRIIQYIPSDIGRNIQIYSDYKFYQFVFESKMLPTIFMLAGEYLFKLKNI